jgi:ferrous iron transport protein A
LFSERIHNLQGAKNMNQAMDVAVGKSKDRSSYGLYKPRGFIGPLPMLIRLARSLLSEVTTQMEMLNAHSAKTMSAPAAGPLAASSEPTISLCELERGVTATVAAIGSSATEQDGELVLRLIELGFVPGEPLRVIAQGQPGNEPIAVRLGGTTFALRRLEADYIRVIRVLAVSL